MRTRRMRQPAAWHTLATGDGRLCSPTCRKPRVTFACTSNMSPAHLGLPLPLNPLHTSTAHERYRDIALRNSPGSRPTDDHLLRINAPQRRRMRLPLCITEYSGMTPCQPTPGAATPGHTLHTSCQTLASRSRRSRAEPTLSNLPHRISDQ